MNETTEAKETQKNTESPEASAVQEQPAGEQLGNVLIGAALVMLLILGLFARFAWTSDEGVEPHRDAERGFVDDRDDRETERRRSEDCTQDRNDAEEQFVPECDDDFDRDRDSGGLFPDG